MMMFRVISNKTFFEYKGSGWLMVSLFHVEQGYSLSFFKGYIGKKVLHV